MIKTREDLDAAYSLYNERDHVMRMLVQVDKFAVGVECDITTSSDGYATIRIPMTDGMLAEIVSYYKRRLDIAESKLTELGLALDLVPA